MAEPLFPITKDDGSAVVLTHAEALVVWRRLRDWLAEQREAQLREAVEIDDDAAREVKAIFAAGFNGA